MTTTVTALATRRDVATASVLENFIDEAEKRTWFLAAAGRAQPH
jgi:DNA-binding ferritin-like protein